MTQEQLPARIKTWLNERGLTDSVLTEYQIGWNGTHIVIPVHDSEGNVLFHKYRRDPESTEGPKYRYEKGATSALYGLKTLNIFGAEKSSVVICEGELDCLRLLSAGIQAVSSTGGASTFNEEWKQYFEGVDTYICLDTDDAGIKGAFRIQYDIPHAKIILLPKEVKDVTEFYLKSSRTFTELMMTAESYVLPEDWKDLTKKNELISMKKVYSLYANHIMLKLREARAKHGHTRHLEILQQAYLNKLAEVNRAIKFFSYKRENQNPNRLLAAKAVPIPTYIKFNNEGMACCVWHNEKTPSMHYYEKQNRVKCFGCDKLGDTIDVIQAMHSLSLPKAIDFILGKTST